MLHLTRGECGLLHTLATDLDFWYSFFVRTILIEKKTCLHHYTRCDFRLVTLPFKTYENENKKPYLLFSLRLWIYSH